jgi:hypothetical protein
MIHQHNSYTNITSGTTTQVYTGACTLVAIIVNTTAAGSIKIIDGTSGSTANVGTLKSSVQEGDYNYNITLGNGLRIVTAATSDITIVWRVK